MANIPKTQKAVQLTGEDILTFNANKDIPSPCDYQVLCKVEAVGLCYSDLKLLKQFSKHARKSDILNGISKEVLEEIPSYVPNNMPTVPGHEAVVTVITKGKQVKGLIEGDSYLIQADFRWLKTQTSNGAFGYNFEGALQQFVLLDTRVITSPEGESMLMLVPKNLSASAVALVEPWACVEEAYAAKERKGITKNGQMLIIGDFNFDWKLINNLFERYGGPSSITFIGKNAWQKVNDISMNIKASLSEVGQQFFDDIIYFGCKAEIIEKLVNLTGICGFLNIVLGRGKIEREIETFVGRVHYGNIRIIGTEGFDPCDSMAIIPESGQIRPNDKINVVGAAGPMGIMHVVRNICEGVKNVSLYAGDIDDARLAAMAKIAKPIAQANKVSFEAYNSKTKKADIAFDYTVICAPIPALVNEAVKSSAKNAIVNLFAGIAVNVPGKIDLDMCIRKKVYLMGTSGSSIDDMKKLLERLAAGRLDTNISLAAVCSLEHAIEGIRAVEHHAISGKILVYPDCAGLDLLTLDKLCEKFPDIQKTLKDGMWTTESEKLLLRKYKG